VTVAFLTLDEVLAIHADQVQRYGGSGRLRDAGLLQSALAVPRATFDGAFLHQTTGEMAAAYLFHLVRNHPFIDGNKRTGLMAMLAFLGLNGLGFQADPDDLTDLVLGVAEGRVTKAEIAVFVQRQAQPRRRSRGRSPSRRSTSRHRPRPEPVENRASPTDPPLRRTRD
jgi:death-on-curing protein